MIAVFILPHVIIISKYNFQRMQENRMHQQNQLRNRHDAEMEQSNRHRQNMNEQHQRLRELVDGRDMKPANEYKPPPNWQPPQNRMQGGGDQWGRSGMDQDRRRSGPGGFGGHGGPGGPPGGRPGYDDGFGDRGGFNRSYDGGNHNGGFNDFNGGHHNGGGFNNVSSTLFEFGPPIIYHFSHSIKTIEVEVDTIEAAVTPDVVVVMEVILDHHVAAE